MTLALRTLDMAALREHIKFANSYTRLPKLIEISGLCEWSDWMTVLGEEWTVCDNIGSHLFDLIEDSPFADAVDQPELGRRWLMTLEEQAAWESLPEVVTIWRGCYAANKWGLSWSTDKEVARRFPSLHRYRQDCQPLLVKATVRRDDIIAFKHDRSEWEVVAHRPRHVSTAKLRP